MFASSVIIVCLLALATGQAPAPATYPICDSPIYCDGEVLTTIQMARLNADSKTFVDMKLKQSPAATVERFRAWQAANPTPTQAAVRRFVADNFDAEGSEFQPWQPADWRASPALLHIISDPAYRRFAGELNAKWQQLGRNMSDAVHRQPELYSIIPVPNPVIVPGGRFREFYYWDSYWIVLGLLHSEMHQTVRGMLGNFMSIVDRFGFIPNGGRIYYLGRSQPPLLIPMVHEYLEATGDLAFVGQSIATLEREFAYWFQPGKQVEVRGHRLARYTDRSPGPRPESYWEDRQQGAQFGGDRAAEAAFYAEMKAGAESGMDYSTRWFVDAAGTNNGTLRDLRCRSIVPVELNAVLWWNAQLLAGFHRRLGNAAKAAEFAAIEQRLYAAVQAVFWQPEVGAWLDWDLVNGRPRDYFVPTNLAPLWVGAFNRTDAPAVAAKVMGYVRREGLDQYAGGVPNSLVASGEQWDFPNVWPPMQHMLIVGLANLGEPEAQEMAFGWAAKWVYTNWVGYNRTAAMYEKYSAVEIGLGGSGGEYEVQLGFGWSNGVVLDLLKRYGQRLSSKSSASSMASFGVVTTAVLGLMSRWLH